ncbi:Protein IMPACT [Penicillium diatomitis]|uniref:Protein IMPACT n=1 Tax=Penicillium diatomitis TaxID=2819901 RepID=A0A9W9XLS8_9EURO|nr:Protein IMPACT [Penicillium diatomitis]KAJ5495314.1 Protein IMPACT [Penicillium diatomitis]
MIQLDSIPNQELVEEIQAINAIYEPDTITVTHSGSGSGLGLGLGLGSAQSNAASAGAGTLDLGNSRHEDDSARTEVTLHIPGQANLSFRLGLASTYPETRPEVLGTASTAARGEGKVAVDVLEDIIQRTWQPGAVCLFDVISEAVEVFPELNIGGAQETPAAAAAAAAAAATEDDAEPNETQSSHLAAAGSSEPGNANTKAPVDCLTSFSLRDAYGLDHPPDWTISDVLTEKKSVFVARAIRVKSLAQAQAFLDHLLSTDDKVAAATHNISAWRIKQSKESDARTSTKPGSHAPETAETVIQDYDDDGETAAGGRLLHMMQLMDVWNVLVVVTRWFGRIHLGPARFKLINDAGRDALVKGGFTRGENTSASDKSKKKGKK